MRMRFWASSAATGRLSGPIRNPVRLFALSRARDPVLECLTHILESPSVNRGQCASRGANRRTRSRSLAGDYHVVASHPERTPDALGRRERLTAVGASVYYLPEFTRHHEDARE